MPAKEADQFISPFYYGQTNPPKKLHPHRWRSFPFTASLSQITFLSSHPLLPLYSGSKAVSKPSRQTQFASRMVFNFTSFCLFGFI
jgi:hypothetical protein